jgi:hypothetical protein
VNPKTLAIKSDAPNASQTLRCGTDLKAFQMDLMVIIQNRVNATTIARHQPGTRQATLRSTGIDGTRPGAELSDIPA